MLVVAAAFLLAAQGGGVASSPPYRVGVGVADITPELPIRLCGYAARPSEAERIDQRLHAKALAFADVGGAAFVLLAVDATAITLHLRGAVLEQVPELPPERLALAVTHTHSAPMLTGIIPNMFGAAVPPQQQARIDAYTTRAVAGMAAAVRAALADLRPAIVEHGAARVGFARNRRTAGGPVDPRAPILRVLAPDGALRAVVVGYACHCTTLGGEYVAVGGDWAGYAQAELEARNLGAVAMCVIGCGADANPAPRGQLADAIAHGHTLAAAVQRVLDRPMTRVAGAIQVQFGQTDLPFATLPTRVQLAERASRGGADGYAARVEMARLDRGATVPTKLPYPVQSVAFGDDLLMVFLGGEVVVDYALRLQREYDRDRLFVVGYSNDVSAYIPSERILREGGYEAGGAMIYYGQPAAFAPGVEGVVARAVRAQVPAAFAVYRGVDVARTEGIPPRSPARGLASLHVGDGLRVELVACEPMVEDPVAVDFAPDGSVFVAEMRDYPTVGGPRGRVTRLVDRDGDGTFERAERFLEDVQLPTGVMAWRDGVLVCAAPDVLFAADRDGDGRAEVREVLLSGFATHNEQGLVNSLALGLDGWVHGAGGLFGGVITSRRTGTRLDLRNRDFRFQPDTGALEAAVGQSQQGRARDDFDAWFGCDSLALGWHHPLAERDTRRNAHFAPRTVRRRVPVEADADVMFALSEQVDRYNDLHLAGRTTSACGVTIYRDRWLGDDYAGDLFVCETAANAVRRLRLTPEAGTFAGRRAPGEERREFLASTDAWFRPVQVRTGPDGALWVVDMYRFLIEHPRWVPPQRLGAVDARAGEGMGRIYRVLPARGPRPRSASGGQAGTDRVEALGSPNGIVRDLAHGQLLARADGSDVVALRACLRADRAAATRAHAASLLASRAALTPADLVVLAGAEAPELRAHAVGLSRQWLARAAGQAESALAAAVLARADDADVRVQIAVALALGDWPDARAGDALAALLLAAEADSVLRDAVLSSALPHLGTLLDAALVARRADLIGELAPMVVAAGEVEPGSRLTRALLAPAAGFGRADAFRLAASLVSLGQVEGLCAQARLAVADGALPLVDRLAAADLLGAAGGSDDVAALLQALAPATPNDVQLAAARALGTARAVPPGPVLAAWDRAGPDVRAVLFEALARTAAGASALLERAAAEPGFAASLSPARQQALRRHGDARVRARADVVLSGLAARRADVLARYAGVDERLGDFERGRAAFARVCSACHALEGVGREIGPDLAALTDRSTAGLLSAILDPNRGVLDTFALYAVTLRDGRSYAGRIAADTTNHVEILTLDGARHQLARVDVQDLVHTGVSLMPEGLEAQLSVDEMAHLFAFLRAERRTRKVLAGNAPAVVRAGTDGTLTLQATACEVYGGDITFEAQFQNLGYWHGRDDCAVWTVDLAAPGSFTVELDFACATGAGGNACVLEGAAAPLQVTVPDTGGWDRYQRLALGAIDLPAGHTRLTLRPAGELRGALMDLREVRLTPR